MVEPGFTWTVRVARLGADLFVTSSSLTRSVLETELGLLGSAPGLK